MTLPQPKLLAFKLNPEFKGEFCKIVEGVSTPGAPWQYTQLSRYFAKPRRTSSSGMLAGAVIPPAWRCTEFFIVVLNTQVSTAEWGTEAATLKPPVNTTARPTMASTKIAK